VDLRHVHHVDHHGAEVPGGERERGDEAFAAVVGVAVEEDQAGAEAQALARLPVAGGAGEERGVAAGVAVEAGVEEPFEALAGDAPARAQAGIEPVVDAELARLVAVEVPGQPVDIEAEIGARDAGKRARERDQ